MSRTLEGPTVVVVVIAVVDVCRLTRLHAPSPAPLSSSVYDDCFRRDGEESPSKRVPPRRSRGHHPNVEDSDDNGDGDDSPPHADDDHIHNFRTPGSPNYRAKADSSPFISVQTPHKLIALEGRDWPTRQPPCFGRAEGACESLWR